MTAKEILSMPVNKVSARMATAFFNHFVKHYNLDTNEIRNAWRDFEKLQTMEISLDLALNTAIALARM